MFRLISCIFLLVLTSQYLNARQQSGHFYTHFGKREGLAANDAVSFAQDDKGFMWIGTLNGLQRYDGTRFLTFKQSQNSTHKLPSNYIGPLFFDKQKKLWRMRELADALSHESEASVSISIAEKAKALKPNAKHKLLFYLIFKEALQAVTIQAGGRETTIEIDMVKGDLLFRLHDPGALFDKNNPRIAASIKSIQERAAQLDADLDIEANHKGVSITLITPAQ